MDQKTDIDFSKYWKKFEKPEGGYLTVFETTAFDRDFGEGTSKKFSLWKDRRENLLVAKDPDKQQELKEQMVKYDSELHAIGLDPTTIIEARKRAETIDIGNLLEKKG